MGIRALDLRVGGDGHRGSTAHTTASESELLRFFQQGDNDTLRVLDSLCPFLQKAWKYLGIYMPQGQPLTDD